MTARLAAIAALVAAALAFNLSGYPLLDPDEGRNAEVAREMAATGDYVHPRLNGLPYPDKPVLFYAVTAVFIRVLGPTELAVRLPPLLFTLATLALVWWAGTRWFGKDAGWIAAIAAGASPLTLGFAHTVIMDSATAFWVTLAIVGFVEAIEAEGRKGGTAERESSTPLTALPPYRLTALAWISFALGVLTKGPIALALPLMVVLPYAIWQKRARALLDPVGILAFLAILLPWLRTMSDVAPGFLHHAIVTETFLRLTTPALERTGPWWYFFPVLVAGTLPWIVVLLSGWRDLIGRKGGTAEGRNVLLLLWILVPLVFFSLSQSKRPQYVLPLVPAIGLIVANLWTHSAFPPFRRSGAVTLGAFGTILVFFHSPLLGLVRNMPPAVMEASHTPAYWLGMICIACGAVAWRWGTRPDMAMLALSLPLVSIPFTGRTLLREIGRDRSAVELARAVRASVPFDTEIVGVQAYPPSLPFYLGHTVTLATADGRELTSNYLTRSLDIWRRIPGSTLRPVDWWREAFATCERPRVFVVRSTDADARALLSLRLPRIAETGKYAAYGPCGRVDLADKRISGSADGSAYPLIRLSAQ